MIQHTPSGQVVTDGRHVSPRDWAIVAGIAVILYLLGYIVVGMVRPFPATIDRAGPALLVALVGVVGWSVIRWLTVGVHDQLIAQYRRWVMPGETLVIVQTRLDRAGVVLEQLQHVGDAEPATFVIHLPRHLQQPPDDVPSRERFSPERLKLQAAQLATKQQAILHRDRTYSLRSRVGEADRTIEAVTADLAEVARLQQAIAPAPEWLLDNAYLIRRHTGDVRRNLSKRLYDVLPVLEADTRAGEPRVYHLAVDLAAHTDADVHEGDIVNFINAYQEVSPLTIGELWALPLMLRLALIEQLSRLALLIDHRQYEDERADFWANRLLTAARRAPDFLLLAVAELAREQPNPSPYVVDRLVSQLQGEAVALDPIRAWLERKLGAPLTEVIQQEQGQHAAHQVTIANAIGSLRELARVDWSDVFERVSAVDRVLATDPPGVYLTMDFGTRDRYRAAVEQIARGSRAAEVEIARLAVELARAAEGDSRAGHVGYYLVDAGRPQLEARAGYRSRIDQRVLRWPLHHPSLVYLGSIGLLTVGILAAVIALARVADATETRLVAVGVIALLALLPASELATQIVNYVVTRLLPPQILPKLAFADGIPDEWRTLVVVPTLLSAPRTVDDDLEHLEIRFLANQDANLHFALLADFEDAPERDMPDDEALLATATGGIERLNQRHGGNRFSLFYRRRIWSESEQTWMGWERKRGKLDELNRWLAGETDPPGTTDDEAPGLTLCHVGDASALQQVRFVITLDADTQLPHDAARRLAGTLAHPLNRPWIAPDGQTVQAGYTIIQPRVSTSLPSATATRFSHLLVGPAGTDPYTHAISDVYQDLTGEGTYHGKGIYDVQTFDRVLGERFPEATLLSHDLLEGSYVRVGLASDVELFDQFPRTYQAYASRLHRWTRGDWQISNWCTPWIPTTSGGTQPNPLSPINRWKILDNLRRSLMAPASVALLLLGWGLQVGAPAWWSVLVGVTLLCPPILQLATWLTALTDNDGGIGRIWYRKDEVATAWLAAIFSVVVLPHQAAVSLDAISRTWFRRWFSHRYLLHWQTARTTHRSSKGRERVFLWQVGGTSLFAALVAVSLLGVAASALPSAAPFLLLWLFAPAAVAWSNAERRELSAEAMTSPDRILLRRIARKTWRYFDDFVGPQTNWLPPDNYQAALRLEVAHRTSPTNVGLWLLSTVAANDFGYLTPDQVIDRGLATLETLNKLERFEGHLLNWYNTETLQPLVPRYVSTVDSGNLAASLWALGQGYRDLLSRPVIGPAVLHGLADTLELVQEAILSESSEGSGLAGISSISDLTTTLAALFDAPPTRLVAIVERVRAAIDPARDLLDAIRARLETAMARREGTLPRQDGNAPGPQALYWATQLDRQVADWLALVGRYCPWVGLAPGAAANGSAESQVVARERWRELCGVAPSIRALAAGDCATSPELDPDTLAGGVAGSPDNSGDHWSAVAAMARESASETLRSAERLIAQVDALASDLHLGFLYDPERRLFSIGYNVEVRRLDQSYFDLLASEARLASLVAIARGDAPVKHWFTLGRPFGTAGGRPVLLSWTGTMFEYLMPLLLTHSYESSLLDVACREAVARQIAYGAHRGVPWGISEAAFSAVDANQIYQYQAFGVPDLGLKRGLEADLVVAPYATALALLIAPRRATENLKHLVRIGAMGSYGFYDSIDFTAKRRPEGQAGTIVSTYMAHHQGMTLLSIDNALHANVMQNRFHADPRVRATERLLFERMPFAPPVIEGAIRDTVPTRPVPGGAGEITGGFRSPDTPVPRVHLLANGAYAVMITGAGGGYSRWHDVDITRWSADTTLDSLGSFCYIHDVEQGTSWSATHQPVCRAPAHYAVTFKPDRAEFERRGAGIGTVTDVVVSPEEDAEIRRLTLVNQSGRRRSLEITSYVELALAPHNADRGHPAFSKLFVQTAADVERHALLGWRKPRSSEDPAVWAAHVLVLPPSVDGEVTYETDRARFLGRGRSPRNPLALEQPLSNSAGAVLDPIFSLRCRVSLEPGERIQLAYVTGAADTREKALALIEKFQDLRATERALDLAAFQAQLELRHLRVTADDVQRFLHLASHLLFPNAQLRAAEPQLRQNRLGQARLWAHGISGDLPIMLVTVGDRGDVELVGEALIAHTFWRLRGLKCDLVILDEEPGSYQQPLQDYLKTLIQAHAQHTGIDQPGGIFLRLTNSMPPEDLTLLLTVAQVVLVAARGPLSQQLSRAAEVKLPPPLSAPQRVTEEPSALLPFLELPYFNGLGGFSVDGREYAVYLGPGAQTPAPWVNVMANPSFGALISESGPGFAWYGNSQSNRLLPWSNDPVGDPSSDAIYIRDDESGRYWTPTALPIRELDAYRARHGQGYSRFEHNSHAIEQDVLTFVPLDDSGGATVRVQRLRLRNRSSRRRRLSVFAFATWVLGGTREETQMHVVTSWDPDSRSLLARNVYHPDFGSRVAFASASVAVTSYTADRTEFLGRNGSLASPAALGRPSLARRTGAGLDPCAALQVVVEIDPGQDTEITFLIGQAADAAQARSLVRRFRDPERVDQTLRETRLWWDRLLGTVQVETPVLAVDFLLNRWLLYQTLSCRFWARSAFYQSGGAFGFRDQLQDVLALVYTAPQITRQHILAAAARQFAEGDVQHWWHPQSGAGVRTRISDDLLWLPYVTAHYVQVTGDAAILDEVVPFLEGHTLEENEHERYFVPSTALEAGSLLEHCRRAIARGLTRGPHGLPLIGTGDWNDGLNLVGAAGQGESVWLGWFLIDVLRGFATLLDARGETALAGEYRARAAELATTVEEQAWDGAWYRRAYFDDGTPLGSRENQEARIDSLPQSWGVISGAAAPERAAQALQAVDDQLIRENDGLILLFTPPFESASVDPGYIKGYPPGVRENGGQYTHAAIWVALAFARRGDGDRAVKLLSMLNPIEHTRTPEEVERYNVEPFVVAADVYALAGQVGRGGWTWYTGSSGWIYRVWIEEILGFKVRGDRLRLDPVIPADWPGFKIRYRYRRADYDIVVENPDHVSHGVAWIELDGVRQAEAVVDLRDDEARHSIVVKLGSVGRLQLPP